MKRFLLILLILSFASFASYAFGLEKNVASQKWTIFCFDETDGTVVTGDAANMGASVYIDGVENVIDDTTPTEAAGGMYVYDITAAESNGDNILIYAASSTANVQCQGCPTAIWTVPANFPDLDIGSDGDVEANVIQFSGDSTAADNLELQYDGTGLIGDDFPSTQSEIAAIGGGLAINTTMVSVTVIEGSEQDLANASTSDDSRWTGDDDASGAEFIFRCTPADTTGIPVEIMFEGYYDEPGGASNGATLQVYNFNHVGWDTIVTLTNSTKDEDHEVPLSHAHKAPGGGTLETVVYTIGDVLVKFKQDTTEAGNACLLIDLMGVGFVGNLVTATEIVDEWETQSQADPTGFEVNVKEVGDSAISETVAGHLDVNVTYWEDDAIGAVADGIPAVNIVQVGADAITDNGDGLLEVNVEEIDDATPATALNTACDTVTVTSIGANVITDAACAADIDTLVNDEVADVLKTDTISELGAGAPAATPSIEDAIMLLYMDKRNKTETTASEHRLTNNAGVVITESDISDNGTTFTKGEFGAVD